MPRASQNLTLGTTDSLTETLLKFRERLKLYAAAVLVIRDKESTLRHLEFNEAQLLVHDALSRQLREQGKIRAIVLKARQEGVSTYVAARFFRAIHLYPGKVAMVIADSLVRAGALYDIYARFLENLPPEIAPIRKTLQRQRLIQFSHESELSVRPAADTEAGRAQTIHLLHASELAFWGTGARETWTSLMQAVPDRGSEIVVESTAKGAGGLFHELWEAAEQGESGWLAIFLPWWIHKEYEREPDAETIARITEEPDDFERQALGDGIPFRGEYHRLSMRKLAWRRDIITEKFGGDPEHPSKDAVRGFQQEYPATAEEAFLVSGACFFDEDALRVLTRQTEEPQARGRLILDGTEVKLEKNDRAFVRIYEPPDELGHYVVGGDTAEGKLVASRRVQDSVTDIERGGRDYSAAIVLRLPWENKKTEEKHPLKVVAEIHGRVAPEIFAEQVRLLGQMYSCGGEKDGTYRNKALVGIERSHSSGQTVLRLLREHYHYVPMYWNREMNRLTHKVGRRIGWITDVSSRMPMLDELAEFVRKGLIEIPSRDLVREMVTFVIWPDGKPMAEEGCHDDRVMALAIAVAMVREHRHTKSSGIPEYKIDETTLTG